MDIKVFSGVTKMTDLYKISGKVVKTDETTLTANSSGNLETIRASDNEAIAGTDTNKALTPASGMALVVDQINQHLTNALIYRGSWEITTSTTDYSGLNSYRPIKAGDYFRVTGTGPATIDGVEYNPNDSIIFNQACSATTTITTAMIDHQDHTDASDTVYETATQTLTNKTIDADDNTISDLETDNFKSGVVVTTLGPSSGSGAATNTEIPTALAVRTAIDSSTPSVDNVTIELGGANNDTLQVKDGGISITKINSNALVLKQSETQENATIPSYEKVAEMVTDVAVSVDGDTISYNSDNEIQAIGLIDKNSGNAVYDWVGTLDEYNTAKDAGLIPDSWVCYITDDSLSSTTYAGEIVQVSKTFTTAGNHVDFVERCQTKSYITVFQDRVYVYPSEYTLDSDGMGITFSQNIAQDSVVDVNYFRGIPEQKIDDLIDAARSISIIAPPGSVMIWAGTTVPEGYLLCDGSEVSRTTYDALFSAIGTTYGAGDSSSTFNLPDFQGRYLKQGTSGTYGNESLPNITGNVGCVGYDRNITQTYKQPSGAFYEESVASTSVGFTGNTAWNTVVSALDASRSSSTYQDNAKVNPDNAEILYCIKY